MIRLGKEELALEQLADVLHHEGGEQGDRHGEAQHREYPVHRSDERSSIAFYPYFAPLPIGAGHFGARKGFDCYALRRALTALASSRSRMSVVSQLMQASVTLLP